MHEWGELADGLQMNWLCLRVNQLQFLKTSGKLPILLEESMEYIERCQHGTGWKWKH